MTLTLNSASACLESNNGNPRLRELETMTDANPGVKTLVVIRPAGVKNLARGL